MNAPAGAFAEPAAGAVGNLQRRMFTGPGAFNLNLGVRKLIQVNERTRLEMRAESINVFNRVAWLAGDQTFLGTVQGTAQFNNNITQWNSPRSIQFAVRLLF